MKYYLIAGEASGDLHASNLIKEIKALDEKAEFRFWGGDLMKEKAGSKSQLVRHYKDMAFIGLVQVLLNLRTILSAISFCKKDIKKWQPDCVILVDYPGFNLRIAKFVKQLDIPVFYYISPQLWAWHSSRVKIVRQYVDRMFVILPFEKEFYAKHNVDVDFVGHPLLDVINTQKEETNLSDGHIALLPGSRKQEIKKMLPIMLNVASSFENESFVVAGLQNQSEEFYSQFHLPKNVSIRYDQTYDLLASAKAAIVASGTATLETALFKVPQIVCYKSDAISFAIGRKLVGVKYLSLVNLILDEPVVTELLQENCTPPLVSGQLKELLEVPEKAARIQAGYRRLEKMLGKGGAAKMVAQRICDILK